MEIPHHYTADFNQHNGGYDFRGLNPPFPTPIQLPDANSLAMRRARDNNVVPVTGTMRNPCPLVILPQETNVGQTNLDPSPNGTNAMTGYQSAYQANSSASASSRNGKSPQQATSIPTPRSRQEQRKWTKDECNRLVKAVMEKGVDNINWSYVAACVGNRTVSQCINKWKNDLSREGRHIRWTPRDTEILKAYMNEGLSMKEIMEKMPQYSYIKIYQQFQKAQCNSGPWEDWEVDRLIQLRNEGMGFAEIGRNLNNRHYDSVRNKWNRLYRAQMC